MGKEKKEQRNFPTFHDPEVIKQALDAVYSGRLKVSGAAREFGIPRQTLADKYKGRSPLVRTYKTWLKPEDEDKIAEWLQTSARLGFEQTYETVALAVQKALNADEERSQPGKRFFKDKKPGTMWLTKFLQRHPGVKVGKFKSYPLARPKATESSVREWFATVEADLTKDGIDLRNIEARCFFNCDGSGFKIEWNGEVVLTEDSKKLPFTADEASRTKQQITVLGCASAAGEVFKPVIHYPGNKRFMFETKSAFPEAEFTLTPHGLISKDDFTQWLSTIFVPSVADLPRPVVLFADGNFAHYNEHVYNICSEHNITIYVLNLDVCHIVQPLDLVFHNELKQAWTFAEAEYKAMNEDKPVVKQTFAGVFRSAWERVYNPGNICESFRLSGMYPWNPDAPDYAKLIPEPEPEPKPIPPKRHFFEYVRKPKKTYQQSIAEPVAESPPNSVIKAILNKDTIQIEPEQEQDDMNLKLEKIKKKYQDLVAGPSSADICFDEAEHSEKDSVEVYTGDNECDDDLEGTDTVLNQQHEVIIQLEDGTEATVRLEQPPRQQISFAEATIVVEPPPRPQTSFSSSPPPTPQTSSSSPPAASHQSKPFRQQPQPKTFRKSKKHKIVESESLMLVDQLLSHTIASRWNEFDLWTNQRRLIRNEEPGPNDTSYNTFKELYERLTPFPTIDNLPMPQEMAEQFFLMHVDKLMSHVITSAWNEFDLWTYQRRLICNEEPGPTETTYRTYKELYEKLTPFSTIPQPANKEETKREPTPPPVIDIVPFTTDEVTKKGRKRKLPAKFSDHVH